MIEARVVLGYKVVEAPCVIPVWVLLSDMYEWCDEREKTKDGSFGVKMCAVSE